MFRGGCLAWSYPTARVGCWRTVPRKDIAKDADLAITMNVSGGKSRRSKIFRCARRERRKAAGRLRISTLGHGNPKSMRERMTKILKVLSPAALVLGAGLLVGPASAAPVTSLTGLTETQTSNVEQVHYRRGRCWRHRGHWHCRRSLRRYGFYAYPYYEPYPYYYGYGPTIGFSFGGGRHFHGRRHFHGGGRHFHGGRHGRR